MHALLNHDQVLHAILRSPAGEKAAETLAREQLATRKRLAEQLAAVETHAAAEWPRLTAKIEEAAGAVKAAERALVAARAAYRAAENERGAMSFGADARRGELERELRATAHPAIAEFRAEMDRLRDAARRAVEVASDTRVNKITAQVEARSVNNLESIRARIAASFAAQDAADALALEADQSNVPARLDDLRAAIPEIEKAKLP